LERLEETWTASQELQGRLACEQTANLETLRRKARPMPDSAVSIDGVARPGEPEPVWIARSKTHIAELSILCADPIGRGRVAIYAGGEGRKWYMPRGAVYRFFDDGEVEIYPLGLRAGKQPVFVIAKEIYDGFPEHCGIQPIEFQIFQCGYDPEAERRGHPLPLHFHWIWMNDDPKVPSAVHCSTEPFKSNTTIVAINVYRADPKRVIPRAHWKQFAR
jgi:hypothetical protein